MGKSINRGELNLPTRYNSKQVSFWINPTSHPTESDFLKILETQNLAGHKPREVIVDAVLHARGRTPEMYDRRSIELEQLTSKIRAMLRVEFERSEQTLLQEFGKQLIEHIKKVGIQAVTDDSEEDTAPMPKGNAFLSNFASAFASRRNSGE